MREQSRVKLSVLRAVFPPISNQEAEWLQNDPDAEAQLRKSDIYMIGARAEATFTNLAPNLEMGSLSFGFEIADTFYETARINVRELPGAKDLPISAKFRLEAGPKVVKIWHEADEGWQNDVIDWFTTEKLLWDRGHALNGIDGLDRYRDAATYELLYVGISTGRDTFERLFEDGHKARLRILGNEYSRNPGSRVTDEIYLFMFQVEPLVITMFGPESDFNDHSLTPAVDRKRIVKDAEKAFVKMLNPRYNITKFSGFPKSVDGLYGSEYDRYGYVLGEPLTFDSPNGRFAGQAPAVWGGIPNGGDIVLVDGESVTIHRAAGY